MGGCFLVGCQR